MGKLWEKGYQLDKAIEKFTVGEDYLFDQSLVRVDVLGSIAHAKMLHRIGVLETDELEKIVEALRGILRLHEDGKFVLSLEDEDVHTKVENFLTEKLGSLGKKLHTARSRNDQILLDIRLFTKERLFSVEKNLLRLCRTLCDFAERTKQVPMVGRTHFQKAMPSSVGLWAGSFLESLLDDLELLKGAFALNDQSPLGSAASYGVSLPIDRQFVAGLLGFSKVQGNVLYAGSSRGKIESVVLSALVHVMMDLARLANDLIIFSAPEFGYFRIPEELCTGSSLMPQKRNPCALELVRAKASTVLGYLFQVLSIIKALPSGYNRDFQETKGPLMRAFDVVDGSLSVCDLTMQKLVLDEERLLSAFTPEVFATDRVLELVKEGVPFRDAYRQVASSLGEEGRASPKENIQSKTHIGAPGNLGLEVLRETLETESARVSHEELKWNEALDSL